ATYDSLEQRYERGGQIKKTSLTEAFGYADYMRQYGDSALPLFRITDGGQLIVCTADKGKNPPKAGEVIVALVSPELQATEATPAPDTDVSKEQPAEVNSQPQPASEPAPGSTIAGS